MSSTCMQFQAGWKFLEHPARTQKKSLEDLLIVWRFLLTVCKVLYTYFKQWFESLEMLQCNKLHRRLTRRISTQLQILWPWFLYEKTRWDSWLLCYPDILINSSTILYFLTASEISLTHSYLSLTWTQLFLTSTIKSFNMQLWISCAALKAWSSAKRWNGSLNPTSTGFKTFLFLPPFMNSKLLARNSKGCQTDLDPKPWKNASAKNTLLLLSSRCLCMVAKPQKEETLGL